MPKKWDPVHPFGKSKSSSSSCPIAMPPFPFSPPSNHWSGDLICLSSCAKGWDVSMEEKLKYRHQKPYQKKKHPCASQSSSAWNSKESAGLDLQGREIPRALDTCLKVMGDPSSHLQSPSRFLSFSPNQYTRGEPWALATKFCKYKLHSAISSSTHPLLCPTHI